MKETNLNIALIAGRFTLLDQSAQAELYPLALAKKVSIIAAGVFNSGVLANPVEGAYWDPKSDFYVSQEEMDGINARLMNTLRRG